jgi:hypothetical protein
MHILMLAHPEADAPCHIFFQALAVEGEVLVPHHTNIREDALQFATVDNAFKFLEANHIDTSSYYVTNAETSDWLTELFRTFEIDLGDPEHSEVAPHLLKVNTTARSLQVALREGRHDEAKGIASELKEDVAYVAATFLSFINSSIDRITSEHK